MVKILSIEPDPEVVKRISCRECGARLEYVPNDVKHRKTMCMGEFGEEEYIECPNCHKRVVIYAW